jgi:hypothetical protein
MRMPMRPVPALPVVGAFVDRLLFDDLPQLPVAHRREVVEFVARRVDTMPSFTRFGVLAIGTFFKAILALPAGWTIARLVMALPLPFVSEYPRLARSLSVAYVWERWPSTTPTGGTT